MGLSVALGLGLIRENEQASLEAYRESREILENKYIHAQSWLPHPYSGMSRNETGCQISFGVKINRLPKIRRENLKKL